MTTTRMRNLTPPIDRLRQFPNVHPFAWKTPKE